MIVDLRSDTVTKPTPEMYRAMAEAPLGDDVLDDDPTVDALEELAAEKMGKEAAMFVPSGTMGNQLALRTWLERGDAAIVEEDCHILYYESGAPGALAGAVLWTLRSDRGVMDPSDIERRVTKESIHTPGTKLLCLENTHNRAGGTIIPQDRMAAYCALADRHGMRIHLDGARIFNAAIAQGIPAREIAQYADSVMFCLSKGLSCPVGSLLTGPADFIKTAKHHRKRVGGTMRQSGVLAACGVYALNHLVERLADDHRRAKQFAEAANSLAGLSVDMATVQTNIVRVNTSSPAPEWASALAERGVKVFATSPTQLRFVFHREVDDSGLEHAIGALTETAERLAGMPV